MCVYTHACTHRHTHDVHSIYCFVCLCLYIGNSWFTLTHAIPGQHHIFICSPSIPLTPFYDTEECGSHGTYCIYLFDPLFMTFFQNFPATLPPHRSIPLPFASNSSQQYPHFPGVDVSSTCLSLVYHYPPHPAWAVTPYLVRRHS